MRFFREPILISLLFLMCTSVCFAQNAVDIKVKKPSPITREFLYQGKPVKPEALGKFFVNEPIDKKDTEDLKATIFAGNSYFDTNLQAFRSDVGAKYYERVYHMDSNTTINMGAMVWYNLVGRTSGEKYVLQASFNEGTSFITTIVFIVYISGDKLIKLGGFLETYDTQNYPVEIKGNIITNGAIKYEIPPSAR